jgi:hypothetical protein
MASTSSVQTAIAQVAAGGDDGKACLPQQEMVERRVGQHDAEIGVVRRLVADDGRRMTDDGRRLNVPLPASSFQLRLRPLIPDPRSLSSEPGTCNLPTTRSALGEVGSACFGDGAQCCTRQTRAMMAMAWLPRLFQPPNRRVVALAIRWNPPNPLTATIRPGRTAALLHHHPRHRCPLPSVVGRPSSIVHRPVSAAPADGTCAAARNRRPADSRTGAHTDTG